MIMTISELIKLAQSRLSYLNNQRGDASSRGDVEEIVKIDGDIAETQDTINKLQSLVT